jgi:hypothetical protein
MFRATMKKRPPHRWFHALVVTGASVTACGSHSDDSSADASADTSPAVDAPSVDVASRDADAGGAILITVDGAGIQDVRNDPRCCIITR